MIGACWASRTRERKSESNGACPLRDVNLLGENVKRRLAMTPRHRSLLSVLVVDDSLPMRAHLRALLNQEPGLCLSAEADNGADAVEAFFRYRPDIVLLDVCLPDRSGFEVMQCFKQASPSCAVILLSDAPDPCVDEVSHLLGATEVCHKSSEFNRIREVLRRLVQAESAVAA
jgi:DNA-binding NarL/FixJ family response regulator